MEGFYTAKGIFIPLSELEAGRSGGVKGKQPNMRVGYKNTSNSGDAYVVIDYFNAKQVVIEFEATGTKSLVAAKEVRNGCVKDPFVRSVCGVGFMGQGRHRAKDKAETGHIYFTDTYQVWSGMMQRVYSENSLDKHVTYRLSSVCDEWHNYQNAADWYLGQVGFCVKENSNRKYHLDKDLLVPNNTQYGPTTCCFLPNAINVAMKGRQLNSDKKLPAGVYWHKASNGYVSSIDIDGVQIHLGCFKSPEDAYQEYKKNKEKQLKQLANKYRDTISEEAYNALINYNLCERSLYHTKRDVYGQK